MLKEGHLCYILYNVKDVVAEEGHAHCIDNQRYMVDSIVKVKNNREGGVWGVGREEEGLRLVVSHFCEGGQ